MQSSLRRRIEALEGRGFPPNTDEQFDLIFRALQGDSGAVKAVAGLLAGGKLVGRLADLYESLQPAVGLAPSTISEIERGDREEL
jgi:hypothetical protein